MGLSHHKAPAPAPFGAGRRGEGSIEGTHGVLQIRRMPFRAAPGAHSVYKYAGDRKTEGLRPGNEVQMAASLSSIFWQVP